MSSINDQSTFQSPCEDIKPNRLVQPSAQERPQTPAAASEGRRPFPRHSPQSSSAVRQPPQLVLWPGSTHGCWLSHPLLTRRQNSSHWNSWVPSCNPKSIRGAVLTREHFGTLTLPDKPTPCWYKADKSICQAKIRDTPPPRPHLRETLTNLQHHSTVQVQIWSHLFSYLGKSELTNNWTVVWPASYSPISWLFSFLLSNSKYEFKIGEEK